MGGPLPEDGPSRPFPEVACPAGGRLPRSLPTSAPVGAVIGSVRPLTLPVVLARRGITGAVRGVALDVALAAPTTGASPARPEEEREHETNGADDEQDDADSVEITPSASTLTAHHRTAPAAMRTRLAPNPIAAPFRHGTLPHSRYPRRLTAQTFRPAPHRGRRRLSIVLPDGTPVEPGLPPPSPPPARPGRDLSPRTVLMVVGIVLGVLLVLSLGYLAWRAITWILIAAFLAMALNPLVEFVQRRPAFVARWLPRSSSSSPSWSWPVQLPADSASREPDRRLRRRAPGLIREADRGAAPSASSNGSSTSSIGLQTAIEDGGARPRSASRRRSPTP